MSDSRATSRHGGSHMNRRDVLRTGTGLFTGLALSNLSPKVRASEPLNNGPSHRSVILILMVGGPSQLETWDPKPSAPSEIRGPFGSIPTRIPGIQINEYLPKLAQRLNQVAILRSLYHEEAPIHETGLHILQTGMSPSLDDVKPHVGALVSKGVGPHRNSPPFVVIPERIEETGHSVSNGLSPCGPGQEHDPLVLPCPSQSLAKTARFDEERFGSSEFGRSLEIAFQQVRQGSRLIVVNMSTSVFDKPGWDAHGRSPFSTLGDYSSAVLPTFDHGFSGLIDALYESGLSRSTLVVASGEFGRTPYINPHGGRDHWAHVWSAAVAGGGISGGQVIGASDEIGMRPSDRPIHLAELHATIRNWLGIASSAESPDTAPLSPKPVAALSKSSGICPLVELWS